MGDALVIALLVSVALGLGALLSSLAIDDAFILYRYAHNLARGLGFAYNPGRPVLSATSPLYALLLGALASTGLTIPLTAHWLSSLCLLAAGLATYLLGRREAVPWAGALAALLLAAFPLLWLSLGLETALSLALVLWAVYLYRAGKLMPAAGLAGLAVAVRPDASLAAAVMAGHYVVLNRFRAQPTLEAKGHGARLLWPSIKPLLIWVLIPGLFYAALALYFGSPLPVTLTAKSAQAALGITGFYPHTTYPEGLLILIRAWFTQSPLYLLYVPLALAGLWAIVARFRWAAILLVWAALHAIAYTALGVAPYYWYYAPLIPALAWLAGLGAERIARTYRGWGRWGLLTIGIILLVPLAQSQWAIAEALGGPVPPPDRVESKALPEAKAEVYREVGLWLRDNAPPDALVGVTELGVIGYYSDRPMLDFLGLLEPKVARAIARGDLCWALLHYQPDYLVLTAISPLYDCGLRDNPWFQAAYSPVKEFRSDRFWGSPVVIYARDFPRSAPASASEGGLPPDAMRLDAEMEGGLRLLGYSAPEGNLEPGHPLILTLYWEALSPPRSDYTVFVHLLGLGERVIAQRDAPPGLGSQPTSGWEPGRVVVDFHPLALPAQAYAPDVAQWEVGLYDPETAARLRFADGSDNLRFGRLGVMSPAQRAELTFECGPTLTGYALGAVEASPGKEVRLELQWRLPTETDLPYQARVSLTSESGQIVAESKSLVSEAEVHLLRLALDLAPGAYDLEIQVTDLASSRLLPLLGADGLPQGDGLRLTKVRVWPG